MEVDSTPGGNSSLTDALLTNHSHYRTPNSKHSHGNFSTLRKNGNFSDQSNLKRYNSEPMINVLDGINSTNQNNDMQTQQDSMHSTADSFRPIESGRIRRFSTSTVSLPHSPTVRTPSRIHQIRQEETGSRLHQEVAHEREVQSAMYLSQSCERVSLDDEMSRPLHIIPPPLAPITCSPSPSRVGKQCFSPSTQHAFRTYSLTPSPSPSPTRKTFHTSRRSISPIVALRPASLSLKRKLDTDERESPSIKRPMTLTPDRPLAPHPLMHSTSSSSVEETSSPEQSVPSGHASSIPSTPTYTFQPVNHYIMAIDSEASTTDSSDQLDSSHNSDTPPYRNQNFVTQTRL